MELITFGKKNAKQLPPNIIPPTISPTTFGSFIFSNNHPKKVADDSNKKVDKSKVDNSLVFNVSFTIQTPTFKAYCD
jgi:hypothetical protein